VGPTAACGAAVKSAYSAVAVTKPAGGCSIIETSIQEESGTTADWFLLLAICALAVLLSVRRNASQTRIKLLLPLLLLLFSGCSGSGGESPCDTTTAVELPSGTKISSKKTFYRISTPDISKSSKMVWNICVSYADAGTAATNHTEPDIIYTFGARAGKLSYKTPNPSIKKHSPAPGITTVEWCRDLTEDTGKETTPSSYSLTIQSDNAPPPDGTQDVLIKASIRYK